MATSTLHVGKNFQARVCTQGGETFTPTGPRGEICPACMPAVARARSRANGMRKRARKRQHVAATPHNRRSDATQPVAAVKALWDSGDHEAIGAWLSAICLRQIALSVARQVAMVDGGPNPAIDAMMRQEWS